MAQHLSSRPVSGLLTGWKKTLCSQLLIVAIFLTIPGSAAAVKLVKGQTIYIPSYANIISGNQRIVLRANLVVHNADPSRPIDLVRVDHYDTNGRLVENYLQQPLKLPPLGAARIIVKAPRSGDEGAGANFIVQWRAPDRVIEPLVECIMVGAAGTHSYSFSSHGRIIQEDLE